MPETNPFAPTNNMPLTSVDELSRPLPGQPLSTAPTANASSPPSAGANQQVVTDVPKSLFGGSAPPESKPPSSTAPATTPVAKPAVPLREAKHLGPALTVSGAWITGTPGAGVQADASAAFSKGPVGLTPSIRVRAINPVKGNSFNDVRLALEIKVPLESKGPLKADFKFTPFGTLKQVYGGDPSFQLGARAGIDAKWDTPLKGVSVKFTPYVEASQTFKPGKDDNALVIGSSLSGIYKNGPITVEAGANVETWNLLDRGVEPRAAAIISVTGQINENVGIFASGALGISGSPSVSSSLPGDGEKIFSLGLRLRTR